MAPRTGTANIAGHAVRVTIWRSRCTGHFARDAIMDSSPRACSSRPIRRLAEHRRVGRAAQRGRLARAAERLSSAHRVSQFAKNHARKRKAVANVAAREAARLRGDAVHPFQTGAAHPDRRAAFFAGDKIDGRADAQRHLRPNGIAVPMDPEFLLGSTRPTNSTSGRACATPDKMRKFSSGFSSNPQGGLSRPTILTPGQRASATRAARSLTFSRTEQEDAHRPVGAAAVEELGNQVAAGDPLRKRGPGAATTRRAERRRPAQNLRPRRPGQNRHGAETARRG